MSEASMTVSTGVPEVIIGSGSLAGPTVPPTFSGKWSDMASDLAAIAKETGIPAMVPAQPQSATSEAVVTPQALPAPIIAIPQVHPQTVSQASAPAVVVPPVAVPVEVPEKFRGVDGKLDQEKLLKSYGEAERALKTAQNKLNQPQVVNAPSIPQAQANNVPQVGNLTPLELQVAKDLFNSGAGYTEAQAIATARVQVRLSEASAALAREAAMGPVSQLLEAQGEQRRVSELQSLAKNYPDVLTPKGYDELVKVRQENPWLDNSPEPWKAAAQILVGQKGLMQGQAGTVIIPTPMGAQTSNPLPVSPSPTAANGPVQLNTAAQIDAYIKTLSKDQEAEFWKKSGFKWDVPRAQFKGL